MNEHDNPTLSDQAAVEALETALADRAVWVQPPLDLQEQIVAAIAAERADPRRRRPRFYALLGSAAAIALVAGAVIGFSAIRDDHRVEYSAALSGTALSPGATGEVTLIKSTSGWKIHLRAHGLPRRANGEYYEAWLKSAAGQLVPVGTFNDFGDVTLWSGVPPTTHPTFTVTRQLANGDPMSTGEVVLKGSAQLDR